MSNQLIAAHGEIENKVTNPKRDGKFIDKEFVKDMYKAFLCNYLDCASENDKLLLYSYV